MVHGIDPPAENFRPSMVEHPRLRIYVLQGKQTSLIWCRDKENTWKTELQEGRPPEELKKLSISLKSCLGPESNKVRIYDPWKNLWTDGQVVGDAVNLPTFCRSIIVRVEKKSGESK